MTRRTRTLSIVLSVALLTPPVWAEQPGDVDAAKRLFDAGAQAYGAGQFAVAIQAFEQANRLVPKPAILFSLAQAQRRQYAIEKNPALLRGAIQNFRTYLQQVPDGGRRLDAAQALSDLELLESRLGVVENQAKPPAKEPARLMIMSRTPGAVASIDGGPARSVPLGVEVSPGKRHVRVSAPGFFPEDREPVAIENTIVPVDVTLRAKPAQIVVQAPSGAEVAVDGRPLAEVGKASAIEVPAGVRFVAITKNGRLPHTQEIELGRGEQKVIVAPLRVTQQRIVSYGFLGVAVAAGALSGLAALSALGHQDRAREIRAATETRNIDAEERSAYVDAIDKRDRDTRSSLIALGVAGGAATVGALLWLFDQPSVPPAPARREVREGDSAPSREPTEIGLVPGPGLVGAGVRARF